MRRIFRDEITCCWLWKEADEIGIYFWRAVEAHWVDKVVGYRFSDLAPGVCRRGRQLFNKGGSWHRAFPVDASRTDEQLHPRYAPRHRETMRIPKVCKELAVRKCRVRNFVKRFGGLHPVATAVPELVPR